jgi:putative DNA primase/helicase
MMLRKTSMSTIAYSDKIHSQPRGSTYIHGSKSAPLIQLKPADLQVKINTPEQRQRRQVTREVADMYTAIAGAAGFSAREIQTAFAISCKLYEREGQACDTPRPLSLATIGAALASNEATGRNRAGYLFNHAIPEKGYQILTRLKSEEESGRPHEYADHLTPIAAVYASLYAEEKMSILRDKGLTRKEKGIRIAESQARLALEALDHLPKCDTELIAPDGETYAYVSGSQASAFMVQKKNYTARPYKYTPPAPDEQKRPLYSDQQQRLIDKVSDAAELALDEMMERNSFDEALQFSVKLEKAFLKRLGSWRKVSSVRGKEGEEKELIHVSKFEGGGPENASPEPPPAPDTPPVPNAVTPTNFVGVSSDKPLNASEIEKPVFEVAPEPCALASGASAEPDSVPAVNFDSSLEAATFYARDGFPVLPVCQWDADAGRCTGEKHGQDCKSRKPLVKGDGSEGYSGATRDLAKIQDWFTRLFPRAGVAIRMDGHIAIDCDVKDNAGGLDSYQILADTFVLPDTLSAITHSGGRHFIFRLPEGLPADWLKSWIRIGDKAGLPGIDLKVDTNGLLFVEPTCGPKGVYRWIDPCQAPVTLPRACADFLHETRYRQNPAEKAKAKAGKPAASSPSLQNLQCDQTKFFRDVPPGAGQHDRLRAIGVAIRCQTRASASEIADAMRWHASRFSTPLDDQRWIERTAKSIEKKF